MRRKAELNISSYNFWELDADKPIHIEHEQLNFANKTMMYTPHRIPHFVIRLIKQGSGKVTIDHIDYQIKPDILFIGHPDQIRLFDVDENIDFETTFVAFTRDIFALMNLHEGIESLIELLSRKPLLELHGLDREVVDEIFSLMVKTNSAETLHNTKITAALLQVLLLTIADINEKTYEYIPIRKQTYLNLYRAFLSELNTHYKKHHFASDYAEMMLIPLKRLNRACNYVTDKTAGKIIADRLDFEAKRYLYYSSNTIKEISYELGFTDPTYFIKFFRTMNGIAPKAFRQKITKLT